MTWNKLTRSSTDFAIGPTASNVVEIGTTPFVETRPWVRSVYKEARFAGEIRELLDSVPSEKGAYPAEMEVAEPVEGPDGF
jgi:hypothetical protein